MRTALFSVIIWSTILISCTNGQTPSTSLSALEFSQKTTETSALIIDARTPEEFSKGHLINAKNIDWNGTDFENQISKIDKTAPVFIYCHSGRRSAEAASKMRSEGFKQVYELEGGIMKWRAANLPESITNPSLGMSKIQYDEILNSDKLVLVDFYAEWCAPCKKMKPYLDEISKEMSNRVTVIRINADDNQSLVKELKIDALPVLLLYKNKTEIWKNQGFIEKSEVLKHLN